MELRKWVYYLFKDNKRFWVCAEFYFSHLVLLFVNYRLIKPMLSTNVIFNIALWNMEVIAKTMKFKIESGDTK
jgi:hypothetical protein